ncbi:MAG: PmoA family protein [Acidobacteria bacterium]|nr:PmoA family protein [Acidobacteriota bacterium]
MRHKVALLVPCFLLVLALSILAAGPAVSFKEGRYQVDVFIGGELFTSYMHTPDPSRKMVATGILQTKPILYPLTSPSGTVLTRAYPFEDVAGEAKDHPHHQGLYFTVDNVGPDKDVFWGNSKNPLPAIKHVKITKMKGGNGAGTLAALSHWVGKAGKPLLEEQREMVFRSLSSDQTAIDFTITLRAIDQDITIDDTKEGMFAIRVAQWLTEKAGARYINSNGEELEKGVWGKRARWVRLQGEKDGKKYGIVIMDHPKSTNSPTWWHARGYGCFSVNPLGQLDFEKAHKAPDPKPYNLTIKKGQQAPFIYRVLLYEGDADQARVETLYKAYAK